MATKIKNWFITIGVALMTLINAWFLFGASNYVRTQQENAKVQQENKNRITILENTQLTKSDIDELTCIIADKIDARFDKFELYLQNKYKITPKK